MDAGPSCPRLAQDRAGHELRPQQGVAPSVAQPSLMASPLGISSLDGSFPVTLTNPFKFSNVCLQRPSPVETASQAKRWKALEVRWCHFSLHKLSSDHDGCISAAQDLTDGSLSSADWDCSPKEQPAQHRLLQWPIERYRHLLRVSSGEPGLSELLWDAP